MDVGLNLSWEFYISHPVLANQEPFIDLHHNFELQPKQNHDYHSLADGGSEFLIVYKRKCIVVKEKGVATVALSIFAYDVYLPRHSCCVRHDIALAYILVELASEDVCFPTSVLIFRKKKNEL
jgi:hypothetical protein